MKLHSVFALAFTLLLGLSAQALAAQVEEHSSWESIAPLAVQDAVNKSGKQTVIIVTDQNNCSACGRMLQQFIYAAADYPNIDFQGGTAAEWGIPAQLLPFILVVTPNCGVTRRMPNYLPDSEAAIKYLIDHINDGAAMQPVTRTCK